MPNEPWVSTACGVNDWKPRMTAMIVQTAVIGRSNGQVMCQNRCHELGAVEPGGLVESPARSRARPARKRIRKNAVSFQMLMMHQRPIARSSELVSQLTSRSKRLVEHPVRVEHDAAR